MIGNIDPFSATCQLHWDARSISFLPSAVKPTFAAPRNTTRVTRAKVWASGLSFGSTPIPMDLGKADPQGFQLTKDKTPMSVWKIAVLLLNLMGYSVHPFKLKLL